MAITLRSIKTEPLTHSELDENFVTLNNSRIKTQALGDISGSTTVDISLGNFITATMLADTTLTFTGLPEVGYTHSFILAFTGVYPITFPVGTKFFDGTALNPTGPEYHISCLINDSGVVTVYGIIDNIATLV